MTLCCFKNIVLIESKPHLYKHKIFHESRTQVFSKPINAQQILGLFMQQQRQRTISTKFNLINYVIF